MLPPGTWATGTEEEFPHLRSAQERKQSQLTEEPVLLTDEPKQSGEQESYAPRPLSRKVLLRQLHAGTRSNAPHGFSLHTHGSRRKRAHVWVAEFLEAFDVDAGIAAPDLLPDQRHRAPR